VQPTFRTIPCLVTSVALWAASASAAGNSDAPPRAGRTPTTFPAELPPLQTTSTPMAHQYDVLLTRSIFAREKTRAHGPTPEGIDRRPETTLVLRGVMDQDGVYSAFIEDTTAGKLQELKPGDTLAAGKVARITLAGVEYEASGHTTRVGIGSNFDGVAVAAVPPSPEPPAAAPRRANESAAQTAAAKAGPSEKIAASERLAKIRQKRQSSGG